MLLREVTGSIADFHARPIPDDLTEAEVWSFAPSGPALVLGSAQDHTVADAAAVVAAGVDVVRRRSGGGAVYVDPDRCVWLDVVVPRHDPRWSDDVRASAYWLGEAWQRALATIGVAAEVYRGGLEQTPWGRLVCFAALGPGEVIVEDRKLVGISQRRTRAGARFQCIAYEHWDPYDVLDLVALTPADRQAAGADLATRATGVGPHLAALRIAVLDELRG